MIAMLRMSSRMRWGKMHLSFRLSGLAAGRKPSTLAWHFKNCQARIRRQHRAANGHKQKCQCRAKMTPVGIGIKTVSKLRGFRRLSEHPQSVLPFLAGLREAVLVLLNFFLGQAGQGG